MGVVISSAEKVALDILGEYFKLAIFTYSKIVLVIMNSKPFLMLLAFPGISLSLYERKII